MTDIKATLKNALKGTEAPEKPIIKQETGLSNKPKKQGRGRPSITHKNTKLNVILVGRGMSRKDLYDSICEKYPDEPISPDAVSRIVSGSRTYYSCRTLYRICGALGVTPNMVLDWENEVL